jgi:hypothetical protein
MQVSMTSPLRRILGQKLPKILKHLVLITI